MRQDPRVSRHCRFIVCIHEARRFCFVLFFCALCVRVRVCVCRNAGKESSKERLGGSVLDKIPFLHGCEDDDEDDSDEDDDFQGMATDCIDGPRKNKKSRAKVR